MSLKAELETWASALKAYDEEDFERALDLFSRIADNSKILTNMGLIYATLGEHEAAVEQFNAATGLDQYLAVAYFQCGVSNFLLGRYELALRDFDEALLYLRGNQAINYEQLGLKFKLFSAEVLFNKGLSLIYLGRIPDGLQDMEEARREKATDEHNVIDDAIQDRGEGYTVFSIPVGVLYRPSESKLKNSKTKDYMGRAMLVAASDASEAYTAFSGAVRLQRGITPQGARIDDRPSSEPAPALSRSQTVPNPPLNPDRDLGGGGAGSGKSSLERSKTTLNVPSDVRERIAGLRERERQNPGPSDLGAGGSGSSQAGGGLGGVVRGGTLSRPGIGDGSSGERSSGGSPGTSPSVSRNNSARGFPAQPARSNTIGGGGGGITRGLSVRGKTGAMGGGQPSPRDATGPPVPEKRVTGRLTEIYDDYIEGYVEDVPPLPNGSVAGGPGAQGRVAAWAQKNANPSNYPSRAPSRYAPSSVGGSMRRKGTMRRTMGGVGSSGRSGRTISAYEEEEEGYVSGEYDDGVYDLVKIRVKVHYLDEVRGMTLTPDTPFDEFIERITQKFGRTFESLDLKFKDEDGGKVTLRDDSDYELALETAREFAKGKAEGKLEIWLADL